MKLSVAMITYNHESYIRQAVDSALMQLVSFPMEIVIGEDCSLDNTLSILLEIKSDHPEMIHIVSSDRNVGARLNLIRTMKNCRGEYVAFLEGDDYWTDPQKLARQVAFLDSHPECSVCGHIVRNYDQELAATSGYQPNRFTPEVTDLQYFIQHNAMHTLSMVVRREILENMPAVFSDVPFGDYLIKIQCGIMGKYGFINEIMGVYRMHTSGMVLSNKGAFLKKSITNLMMMSDYLPEFKYLFSHKIIEIQAEYIAQNIIFEGKRFGNAFAEATPTTRMSLNFFPFFFLTKNIIKMSIKKYFPKLYNFVKNGTHF